MRRWHKVGAGVAVLLLAVAGYGTLDVYDVVPGILTRESASRTPVPPPGGAHAADHRIPPPAAPPAPAPIAAATGPAAVPARVAAALQPALANRNLPSVLALTVRDGTTGTHLLDLHPDTTVTPASVTKLLSAWAIANTLDLAKPLTTRAVQGVTGHVVLVAGGDMVLAPGKGNPDAVAGHAGLGDLAAQVAASLRRSGTGAVTVDYDTRYAPGPLTAPGWSADYLSMGYTARIAQLGLSTERADPPRPAAANPPRDAQRAFAKDLAAQGITVHLGRDVVAPSGAPTLGTVESAPLIDVLGLALQDSDNAMVEAITRQAAFKDGVGGSEHAVTTWVVRTLTRAGFDLRGVRLADVCGLSDGTTIPVRVLADLLVSATTGHDTQFRDVLSRLPVGGWNGTLDDRFLQTTNKIAAGDVRAKTGSLDKVSSLAGTVVDRDGRLLVFAIVTNGTFPHGVWLTRAAIDDIVARLYRCGCS